MLPIAVLVSGSGSNLRVLLEQSAADLLNARITCVIADRPCDAKRHADAFDIPFVVLPQQNKSARQQALADYLSAPDTLPYQVQAIVLAGYLSILPASFCTRWAGRIINLHPSLLPKYGGKGMWGPHVHARVLAQSPRDRRSGATVHFVTAEIDEGDILIQASCRVEDDDNVESLSKRVQKIEHSIMPLAVNRLVDELTPNP